MMVNVDIMEYKDIGLMLQKQSKNPVNEEVTMGKNGGSCLPSTGSM